MNILLVAATDAEIAPFKTHLSQKWQQNNSNIFSNQKHQIEILISGVGLVATTFSLTKKLQNSTYDLILQAGVAGCFDRNISLGEVLFVTTEVFADLGAGDHYNFLDIFEIGLATPDHFPFQSKRLINPLSSTHQKIELARVSSLSVNSVSGSDFTAEARNKKYGCTLEGMEGAALHYVCLLENLPFAQIRSVSNYVEARDKTKWKIGLAIDNLGRWLIQFFDAL